MPGTYNRKKLRNLRQYKDLEEDIFENLITQKELGREQSADFETRIAKKLAEFAEDYDLSDQKVNDKLSVRLLIQKYIALEDYEQLSYEIRSQGLDLDSIIEFEKLNSLMSNMTSDIIKLQNDLGISRKARKGDQETTVLAELDRLKLKAKEFYEKKMMYVFCPKCNSLLATTWFLYPGEKYNKIQLVCNQKDNFGEICGEKFTVTSQELLSMRGANSMSIPEAIR